LFAELLVEMQQHFRVRLRDEPVPQASELLRQLDVVVDLPVKDDPECAVVIAHWLVATWRRVQHRKASRPKSDRTSQIRSGVVGRTVNQAVSHVIQQRARDRGAIGAQDSYDAAHGPTSIRARRPRIISPGPASSTSATPVV